MRVFLKSFAKRAANTSDDSCSKYLDFGFWKHHTKCFGIFDDFDEFGPKKSKKPFKHNFLAESGSPAQKTNFWYLIHH